MGWLALNVSCLNSISYIYVCITKNKYFHRFAALGKGEKIVPFFPYIPRMHQCALEKTLLNSNE